MPGTHRVGAWRLIVMGDNRGMSIPESIRVGLKNPGDRADQGTGTPNGPSFSNSHRSRTGIPS